MAEKTLNTRIKLKYDTYENWFSNNPVLKAGEVAIATITTNRDGVQNAPSVLIKVGDGTSNYKSLKFVSGLSADVYSWAKAETKPTYEAGEITGIDAYIADYVNDQMGISVDTDTQYQIVKVDDYNYKLQSKGKSDSAWADVNEIEIPQYDDTALAGRVTSLETLVGSTAVATQIANAIAALNLDNTYDAKGAAADVQANLDTEIARAKAAEGANATAASNAQTAANNAQSEVDALETVVAGKADKATTLAGYGITDGMTKTEIEQAIENSEYDDTALSGRVTTLEETIVGLSGAMHFEGVITTDPTTITSGYEQGDVVIYGNKEYVWNNGAFVEFGDVSAQAEAITDLTSRIGTAEGEIDALETEVAKKANDADLASIAKTGNVNDLVQSDGDVLIFDCGDSNI